jgi:hypothetical protein
MVNIIYRGLCRAVWLRQPATNASCSAPQETSLCRVSNRDTWRRWWCFCLPIDRGAAFTESCLSIVILCEARRGLGKIKRERERRRSSVYYPRAAFNAYVWQLHFTFRRARSNEAYARLHRKEKQVCSLGFDDRSRRGSSPVASVASLCLNGVCGSFTNGSSRRRARHPPWCATQAR